jgi:hypothetical protein
VYATVDELLDLGLAPPGATDDRLRRALSDATALIDAVTGQFFEPRVLSVALRGRGAPTLWTPVPLMRLDAIWVDGAASSLTADDLEIVGAPVIRGLDGPRVTRIGAVFPVASIRIDGLWGYTEPDSSLLGATPRPVRHAALLLAARVFLVPTDQEGRDRARIVEERTRDQAIRFAEPTASSASLTGDAEVDRLLLPYLRQPGVGAA